MPASSTFGQALIDVMVQATDERDWEMLAHALAQLGDDHAIPYSTGSTPGQYVLHGASEWPVPTEWSGVYVSSWSA